VSADEGGDPACWAHLFDEPDDGTPGGGAPLRLTTPFCTRFGVVHPIMNAPMGGGDAPATLAAAVANGGGLGMIGGTTSGGVPWLVDQIHRSRDLTERPFGVGLLSQRPNARELMDAALDEGVRVVAHSFADPAPFVAPAHDAGAIVLCQVRSRDDARRAADVGADVIVAQGTEAGGHTGHTSTLALLPAVVDAVTPTPVVAAGGIADGRALAAVVTLGAEAAWIGTRFLATHESGINDAHKDAVIGAGVDDTVLSRAFDLVAGTAWPDDVAARAVRSAFSDEWADREDELRSRLTALTDQELESLRHDAQGLWAGEASTFVRGRESAVDIVGALAAEAARVLAETTRGSVRAQ
jgi:nitronate monooxygenase